MSSLNIALDLSLPLINNGDTVISNDWYIEGEPDPYKGLHIVTLGELKNIEAEIYPNCRLMCGGCLKHFEMHKLKNVYVEYYWEGNGGMIFKENRHICSTCYLKCVELLEQELPDCKEPDQE